MSCEHLVIFLANLAYTGCFNLPYGFERTRFDAYKVNVKTMRKILQIFVAFSEKLNFKVGNDFLF